MLKVVHSRVDALTMRFRASLHDPVTATLRTRGQIAFIHGRASITLADRAWELRWSRTPKIWNLTREDHCRVRVDLCASDSRARIETETVQLLDVGTNGADDRFVPFQHFRTVEEPGWTLELIFAAQYLADRKLMAIVSEARRIAAAFGDVHEERVGRIDLAADVAGWYIRQADRTRLVTRSRLRMDPRTSGEVQLFAEGDEVAEATMHSRRVITGITVGRGDLMCRNYDKLEELHIRLDEAPNKKSRAHIQAKAANEMQRWREGGWNGIDPVARVEFQIRGAALRELGVFQAEGIVDPIIRKAQGKNATDEDRAAARALIATQEERPIGFAPYNLETYLPRLWTSVTQWLRLAKPTYSRTGSLLQKTRWKLDPRWIALSSADWGASNVIDREPIKRVRDRAPVSSTQAVGALVSLAAAAGKVAADYDESVQAYELDAHEKLLTMLRLLCSWGIDQMAADLILRWGGPAEAASHLAIRINAARGRFAARIRAGPEAGKRSSDGYTLDNGNLEITSG